MATINDLLLNTYPVRVTDDRGMLPMAATVRHMGKGSVATSPTSGQAFDVASAAGALTTNIRLAGSAGAVASALGALGNTGADDWFIRSAGAYNANRMDTQAARDSMVFINGHEANVTFDPTIAPPGFDGSIKIAVLNSAGTDDGAFRFPFGRNFHPGDEFWLSYMVWAPEEWVYQPWATGFECGPKTVIIDDFNETSSGDEIVPGMTDNMSQFGGYNQDGTGSFVTVEDDNLVTACAGGGPFDLRIQPSIDRGSNTLVGNNPDTLAPWTACEQDRRRFARLYQARNNAPNVRPGIGDPFSGGVRMKARTWYTRTMYIKIGTPNVANSIWREWVAEYGQPYIKLWDKTDRKFGTPVANGINTGHFMTYVTGRSPGGRHIASTSGSIGGISVWTAGMGTELGDCTLHFDAATKRLSFRTPNDGYGTPRGFSQPNDVMLLNVCSASDRTLTNLVTPGGSPITLPQPIITVTSTTGFPSAGTIVIGDPVGGAGGVGEERVQYTGKTSNTFTGCSGGTGVHNNDESVNYASYVTVRVDNPALLPSVDTDMTVTVGEGRKDTEFHYAGPICSPNPINAPGGYPPVPSALATLAASMAPGDWAELVTTNMVTSPISNTSGMWLMQTPQGMGGIGADSNNMTWDPVHERINMVGQYHGNPQGQRHIWLDLATNGWTTGAHFGPLGDVGGHGLNSSCCDRNTGDVYHKRYGNPTDTDAFAGALAKFTYDTQTWDLNFSAAPDLTNNAPTVVFWSGTLAGVTGGKGAVVCHDAAFGGCWAFDIGTGTWTTSRPFPAQDTGAAGDGYDEVGAYNRRGNVGMFGGGENPSHIPMTMDSSKTVTILGSISPNALSIRSGTICEHPTQGDAFLSIAMDRHIWKYTTGGVYTDLGAIPAAVNAPTDGANDNFCNVCAIPEYGVIAVVSTKTLTANLYLHKPL